MCYFVKVFAKDNKLYKVNFELIKWFKKNKKPQIKIQKTFNFIENYEIICIVYVKTILKILRFKNTEYL